jgi:hypothetical protein
MAFFRMKNGPEKVTGKADLKKIKFRAYTLS